MLSQHPANLILRFALEITGLVSMGQWGWRQADGALRYVLAVGVPLLAAVLWGVFAVRDDPSRSGKAPVPVSGKVRLALEFVFFGFAVWCMISIGNPFLGLAVTVALLLHYFWSADRVVWLLKQG